MHTMSLVQCISVFTYRFHSSSTILFFFNDPATTEIYTLSLHDALPIYHDVPESPSMTQRPGTEGIWSMTGRPSGLIMIDRKSTRLNSSHTVISYAVFCLKKKKSDFQRAQRSQREAIAS